MKTLLLLGFLNCSVIVTKSQDSSPYIPFSETGSTISIARFIKEKYKTDLDRLQAIYAWVTTNIKYDTDSMYVINSGKEPETRITAALRRRKGVCENYAAVFTGIAKNCGIPCYEVSGYTKQYGSIDKDAHMWCAVYLEGQWYFCDPTWDINPGTQTKYFLAGPEFFIESHMPFDPLWQLLPYYVSHKEFYEGRTYARKDRQQIDFADSLNSYNRMSQLEKFEAAVSRIKQAGIYNEHIRTNLIYLQMQVSIIYQEKNREGYNDAVAIFNNANTMLNHFIEYRNERFQPSRSDQQINDMLSPINAIILAAYKKLDEVDRSADNFQYDTELLRNRLKTLAERLLDQQLFLKRYLSVALTAREKLFYNN